MPPERSLQQTGGYIRAESSFEPRETAALIPVEEISINTSEELTNLSGFVTLVSEFLGSPYPHIAALVAGRSGMTFQRFLSAVQEFQDSENSLTESWHPEPTAARKTLRSELNKAIESRQAWTTNKVAVVTENIDDNARIKVRPGSNMFQVSNENDSNGNTLAAAVAFAEMIDSWHVQSNGLLPEEFRDLRTLFGMHYEAERVIREDRDVATPPWILINLLARLEEAGRSVAFDSLLEEGDSIRYNKSLATMEKAGIIQMENKEQEYIITHEGLYKLIDSLIMVDQYKTMGWDRVQIRTCGNLRDEHLISCVNALIDYFGPEVAIPNTLIESFVNRGEVSDIDYEEISETRDLPSGEDVAAGLAAIWEELEFGDSVEFTPFAQRTLTSRMSAIFSNSNMREVSSGIGDRRRKSYSTFTGRFVPISKQENPFRDSIIDDEGGMSGDGRFALLLSKEQMPIPMSKIKLIMEEAYGNNPGISDLNDKTYRLIGTFFTRVGDDRLGRVVPSIELTENGAVVVDTLVDIFQKGHAKYLELIGVDEGLNHVAEIFQDIYEDERDGWNFIEMDQWPIARKDALVSAINSAVRTLDIARFRRRIGEQDSEISE